MKPLLQIAAEVAAARRRFVELSDRPAGVERVYRLRAEARIDAAEMATALSQAVPSESSRVEAEIAVLKATFPGVLDAEELLALVDLEQRERHADAAARHL